MITNIILIYHYLFTIFPYEQLTGTEAEEVATFQHLFPNPSWLSSGRASDHQKLVPTFPWMDNCLMVTKRDFLEMEEWKRHYD